MIPVLIYDADCGFCTRCVEVAPRLGVTARFQAWQDADLPALGLTEEHTREAAWWVDEAGLRRGHEAIAAGLMTSTRGWVRAAGRIIASRPMRPLASRGYALVARYRYRLPGGTASCRMP